jgi:tricarballylate dehydrogenase
MLILCAPASPSPISARASIATREWDEGRQADGKPAANMFAAGEIMAGNVLGRGYAAGIGMTIGSVFGRIAGREAAKSARN